MNDKRSTHSEDLFPSAPIDRLFDPVARLLHIQSAGGIVLVIVTVIALILANSPLADSFLAIWKTPIGFSFGSYENIHSLQHWINDGLMVIFFFVIGLEVKREIVFGELRDIRTAALPLAAALGGMVVPACIYLKLQWGAAGEHGWGIPMATDIAFVIGCLAILGNRVPRSLRVMLVTLAIADDIGAILVIAVGYTSDLNLISLGIGFLIIGLIALSTRIGIRSTPVYVVLGIAIWVAFTESGVHATIAGVILGLLTPARPLISHSVLADFINHPGRFVAGDKTKSDEEILSAMRQVARAARESTSPLIRLESALHPWVLFVIMPIFALANAGVQIELGAFRDPIALAVMCGLFLGKPIGIFLFSWLAIRLDLARLPASITWGALAAAGILAGIGFTMSLFIAGLALNEHLLDPAKLGILSGSFLSAVLGMVMMVVLLPKKGNSD